MNFTSSLVGTGASWLSFNLSTSDSPILNSTLWSQPLVTMTVTSNLPLATFSTVTTPAISLSSDASSVVGSSIDGGLTVTDISMWVLP